MFDGKYLQLTKITQIIMFSSLLVPAQTLSFIRCQICKTILFRQDHMLQFLEYDPNDFGKLEAYSSNQKYEVEAYFTVLDNKYKSYSSFFIDYNKTMLLNYHPFFMMYVFSIQCFNCRNPIGYEPKTVNENTKWMYGKQLIDLTKCSLINKGKNQIQRMISKFKARLAKRTESLNKEEKKPEINQQKELINQLEKIKIPNKRSYSQKSNRSKKQKSSNNAKKRRFQSLQSTNACTTFASKTENNLISNSNIQSSLFRNEQTSYGIRNIESRFLASITNQHIFEEKNFNTQINNPQKQDKAEQIEDFISIPLSYEEKQRIQNSLIHLKKKIIQMSSIQECKIYVQKSFDELAKIQARQKYVFNNMSSIEQERKNALHKIRVNFIQKYQQLGVRN